MSCRSVLFLSDYQAPYAGNFIASLRHLGNELESSGVSVAYVFPSAAGSRPWLLSLQQEGKTVDFLTAETRSARIREILRLIRKYRADLLHVHFGYMQEARTAALCKPDLKLVLHRHSDFSAGKKPGISGKLRNALISFEENRIGDRIVKINVGPGIPSGPRTVCIPNALVTERFESVNVSRDAIRSELGLQPADRMVLLFGWSPYVKGVDVGCEAVSKLIREGHTEWKLGVICGRTVTEQKMKEWVRTNTSLDGSEDWLLCLPPTEEIFRYHIASDVLLSASRSETFSYSVLEALYLGSPCAISDIPGTRWALDYPGTFVFPSEDSSACADALLKAAGIGKDGTVAPRADIAADYALKDWTKQVLSVYDTLCG